MLASVEFNFTDSRSGRITLNPPSSYVATTGYAACQTGQNTQTGENQRAYFSFDTSSLPDHAQIIKVEFLIIVLKSPFIDPLAYRIAFSIGTFIGEALDGNSEEWSGGAYMVSLYSRPASGTWLNLAQSGGNPEAFVNRTGDTDIRVWDYSIGDLEHWFWMTTFNTSRSKCKLRVTYSIPSATVTGRGTAVAAAGVILSNRGVATGAGTTQAAATVVSTGVAVATGQGAAEAAALVLLTGVAVATGWGNTSFFSLVYYFNPPARHCGTRSVRSAHIGSRSVSWVHARVCSAGREC
jgi:hypothetical protein